MGEFFSVYQQKIDEAPVFLLKENHKHTLRSPASGLACYLKFVSNEQKVVSRFN